jgi:quercetin dioxygenase-like cupin family protein
MTEFPEIEAGPGVARQVLADHPSLMVVAFRFRRAGAEGAVHSHPHVQSTYVRAGRFLFTLGEEEREVGPGDSFVIPADLRHGCLCLEPGELIDCFAPRRDDFL